MADEKIKAVIEPIEQPQQRYNFAYMMSGHAGSIQVSKTNDIPMKSGSMIEEIEKTNSTTRQSDGKYHVSKHLQAIWPDAWINKKYTQLPKKSTADYTYFFQYNTNNNTNIDAYSKTLSMTFKNIQHVRNWYVGSNIYFINRNAHAGGYFNAVMGTVSITVNFFDGNKKTYSIQHSYCGKNEDYSSSVCEVRGLRGTESKDISSITAVFNYGNGGGQWHGANISNNGYKNTMISKGGNSFYNQLIPSSYINFINEFGFNYENTRTDTVRGQKTIVF